MKTFAYPPPSDGKPFRLTMGLRELDPANWLECEGIQSDLKQRAELVRDKREIVFQELPGHLDAASKFAEMITGNLRKFHEVSFNINKENEHPFIQLSAVIAEDLCLLKKIDGKWVLVAGLVVFPSRWDLREKIGLDIDAIHAPVPGYQGELQPLMSYTFDRISDQRPVWRKNWSLHQSSQLHEPSYIPQHSLPANYWWRTERQTLTRLPESDYLLFTIRNRAEPLEWIKTDREAASAFAQTLQSINPQMLEYKRIVADRDALVSYLLS